MAETDNAPNIPPQNAQPGQVINPGDSAEPPAPPPASSINPPSPAPMAMPTPVLSPQSVTPQAPEPVGYSSEILPTQSPANEVSWTASEFVAHEKSTSWYLALAGAAILIAAIIYLVTKDAISSTVVIVGALFLGVYGARKPRQLNYLLDGAGITIGQKRYVYSEFRSFSVAPEGAFSSIVFMPLKRFSPPITIYYAPEQEDEIAAILMDRLPMQEHSDDVIDHITRRLRF